MRYTVQHTGWVVMIIGDLIVVLAYFVACTFRPVARQLPGHKVIDRISKYR